MRWRRRDPYPDAEFHLLSLDLHFVHLKYAEDKSLAQHKSESRSLSTDTEIDPDRGTRLVLGQPLLVGESHEETALADGRISDQEQFAVDD